ncbi:MATE efflux family [Micractinium conductrix]|uniref:Protein DETOXIFICATION n=1 Tax=Micractinium conductrix TaxID=554055 RepID=A0A2P6VP49_9CHLO|nr:MATE efflux family [Micractinium conductrix]|eukprot:PSC75850.1 MATE efflux family [Micractinium conductrix]
MKEPRSAGVSFAPLQVAGAAPRFALDDDEEQLVSAEESRLLFDDSTPHGDGDGGVADGGAAKRARLARSVSTFTLKMEEQESWAAYRHEAGRIAALALPLTISQFFTYSLSLIALLFAGRLTEGELAAAVLATSLMSVTGFSFVLGLLGALDTLCGQAWGAKNYKALGVYLQRAVITTLLISALICVLWFNIEGLVLALGQEPVIAAGAARFLRLATPALLLAGVFECLKRYLMAQGVVTPVTAVSCAAVAAAPPLNWLFIFKLHGGLDGAAFAMVATWALMLCMLGAFVAWHERRRAGTPMQTWHGWSRDCLNLRALWAYTKLAVPSSAMTCLEWWAYEFCIFMAGWLPNPTLHVAAMGIMLQVSGFCYMLPVGLSCATSVRVSNALGAGLPHGARRSAYVATAITALTQASLATALVLGRNVWAAVFTSQPEVIAACAAAFPIMSASMFGDGMNATIGGVLRAAGRQALGAALNLGSYWGVGLPTAYLLAVKAGLELRGLWGGLVTCTTLQGCICLGVLFTFKWEREAARAADLVETTVGAGGRSDAGGGQPLCEDSAAKLHCGSRPSSSDAELPA